MKKVLLLIVILIAGFAGIFALSKQLETTKAKPDETHADDDLYFTPTELAAAGHDFRGLITDWYWINSLQYLGNKVLNSNQDVNINDLKPLNPRLLYPMLDTAVTLDPKFMAVYSYGASVLPAIDNNLAIKLLEKGIAANPDEWRLYHNLGYIYWQMKDYQNAAKYYAEGAGKKNAPTFMKQMSATMQANGGSREFALEIYRQMFNTAEDEQTRNFAELRYNQKVSEIQLEIINQTLQSFKEKSGRCAISLREILPFLSEKSLGKETDFQIDNSQSLVDPTKVPYTFDNAKCEAKLSPESKIPRF